MRGTVLRRLAQQVRVAANGSSRCSTAAGSSSSSSCSSRRAASSFMCTSERQAQQTVRQCERSRLLRQRSSMLPTLVGRSSRQIFLAFRAMHTSIGLFNLDDDGT